MKKFILKNKKFWDKFVSGYKKWDPPYVPSKNRLSIYGRLIKQAVRNSGNDVLLLGATPSLRDILLNLKCNVTILDFSPKMIYGMRFLMKNRKEAEKREKIVIGNWLKTPKVFKNKFDIIVGDSVTNNLTYPELKIFFSEMKKILKPKGSLILTNGGNYTKQTITIERMIDRVKKNPGYYQDKRNLKYDTYLVWAANSRFYNPKTKSLYADVQDIIFKKKFKAGELTKKELKLITTGLGHVRISVLGKEIEALMSKYFKIVRKLKERAKKGFENHKIFDLYYIYELKIK